MVDLWILIFLPLMHIDYLPEIMILPHLLMLDAEEFQTSVHYAHFVSMNNDFASQASQTF